MRPWSFTRKDWDLRVAERRRLFWQETEEASLAMAKRRVEQMLRREFPEALGAERSERSAWSQFLESLRERGLHGQRLELVIHDGCAG